MTTMKVLHCVSTFYPALIYGGTIVCEWDLCVELAKSGVDLRVLTTDANGKTTLSAKEKAKALGSEFTVRFFRRLLWRDLSISYLLWLPFEIYRCAIVHVSPVYSLPAIPTMFWTRVMRKPLVFSPHGSFQTYTKAVGHWRKAAVNLVLRTLWDKRWIVHVTASNELVESLGAIGATRHVMIPNGVRIPDVIEREYRNGGVLRLLFIGRLHPKKGIENLLLALETLKGHGLDPWVLEIAGTGEEPYVAQLVKQVENSGLSLKVKFVGLLDEDARTAAYLSADVVVVPSFIENFGMVVAEALSYGCPVIASKGTPWSVLNETGSGIWCGNSPEELQQAICAIANRDLANMGKNGRALVQSRFSSSASAKAMLECYEQLVGEWSSLAESNSSEG